MRLFQVSTFLLCTGAIVEAGSDAAKTSYKSLLHSSLHNFYRDLIDNKEGLASVWEREPKLWRNGFDVKDALFSFQDAINGAEAGLLDQAVVALSGPAVEEGKWVSDYAPSTSREDLKAALARGTIFFNGAGLDYPKLAELAQLTQQTFGLPVNVNVYVTEPGRDVSVSPHTDAQNVLVFQSQGRKHWRVWAPPKRVAGKNPFGRGKNDDSINMDTELGEPLIDAWLEPGSVLYVPIGFPHATSTTSSNSDEDETCEENIKEACTDDSRLSCHITLGLDTYFYGLTFATLRAIAAIRAGTRDNIDPLRLDDKLHDQLYGPLPLGFLCPDHLKSDDYGGAYQQHVVELVKELNSQAAKASGAFLEPSLGDDAAIQECVQFLIQHWREIINPEKYNNVVDPATAKSGSVASMSAKMIRNSKNAREEKAQKSLGGFASQR